MSWLGLRLPGIKSFRSGLREGGRRGCDWFPGFIYFSWDDSAALAAPVCVRHPSVCACLCAGHMIAACVREPRARHARQRERGFSRDLGGRAAAPAPVEDFRFSGGNFYGACAGNLRVILGSEVSFQARERECATLVQAREASGLRARSAGCLNVSQGVCMCVRASSSGYGSYPSMPSGCQVSGDQRLGGARGGLRVGNPRLDAGRRGIGWGFRSPAQWRSTSNGATLLCTARRPGMGWGDRATGLRRV